MDHTKRHRRPSKGRRCSYVHDPVQNREGEAGDQEMEWLTEKATCVTSLSSNKKRGSSSGVLQDNKLKNWVRERCMLEWSQFQARLAQADRAHIDGTARGWALTGLESGDNPMSV
ncbi:hypothetical protein MUK42_05749 [Musa troglodytarum]|uniref:Uncharacterized protein n=1 Tax=Musa troglodytarum TaxID=320322 RepID=A0A9E7GCH6_9LILI|nr:hypothetical protein MUK42_05749 [Musa troglodytarum]